MSQGLAEGSPPGAEPSGGASPSGWWGRLATPSRAPWVVAVVGILLYVGSLGGDYVLDDVPALLKHPAVQGDAPIWEVFVRAYWGQPLGDQAGDAVAQWSSSYRPLTSLSYAIEHRIVEGPGLHRVVNLVIYGGLCALVTAVARRWMADGVALGVGFGFAVLPVHAENVASIVGRADLMAATAAIGAFCLALPSDEVEGTSDASWGRAAGAAALYLVGLLCKETIALFPALLWWFSWLRWKHASGERSPVTSFRAATLVSVAGVVYIVARQQILDVGLPPWFNGADNPLVALSGSRRVFGTLTLAGRYAEVSLVPLRLCADHTYGDVVAPAGMFTRGSAWLWIGALMVGVVSWDGVAAWRGRSPGLGVALGLSYLLIGNVVIDLSVIMAERLMAWPTVWMVWWLGAVLEEAALPPAAQTRLRILAAVAMVGAGARSVHRSLDWRDSLSLYRSSAASCPRAVHGRLNLAMELHRQGKAEEAVWHFAVAAAGRGAYPEPFDIPAFEAERNLPLSVRLIRLPELVGAEDRSRYWSNLYGYFVSQGFGAEAQVVAEAARAGQG